MWVRVPPAPRLPTRMVSVLKLLRNMTRKKIRQQLKGKFTTKPAYTLKCKVNWEYSSGGRKDGVKPDVSMVRVHLLPQCVVPVRKESRIRVDRL